MLGSLSVFALAGNKSWVDGIPDKHAFSVLPDDLRGRGTATSAAHDGTGNPDAADAIAVEIPPNGKRFAAHTVDRILRSGGTSTEPRATPTLSPTPR